MARSEALQLGRVRLIWVALVVALFSLAMIATSASASPAAKSTVIPGEYIVVLEDSVERPGAVAEAQTEAHDGDIGLVYRHALKGYSAELSKGAVEALRQNPKVSYVVPDHRMTPEAQTIPFGISRVFAVGNPAADIDETDDVRVNADIAVIDGGVDTTHPDLNVVSHVNCVPLDESETPNCVNSTSFGSGHGTHVAGTAAALDNGFGVVGVAPGARIWSVRIFNNKDKGQESWTVGGIDWVTAHAAEIEVANMSIGGPPPSVPIDNAIKASVEAGVVNVAAAGNQNMDAMYRSPGNNPEVITVSALADYDGVPGGKNKSNCAGPDDKLYTWSNWGSEVEIAAPGACVESTLPGGTYGLISGTSMATPHVSGAAVLLAAASNPNSKKDVEAIRLKLVSEGSLNWTDDSGDGVKEPLLDLRPPTSEAITFPASNLQTYSAKLNAVVSAGGQSSSYRFEYGTTTSYGQVAPPSPKSIGSGVGDVEVSETIAVKPETTYHYRIVLTNGKGTFYGEDLTFKTSHWSVQEISNPPAEDGKASELRDVSCVSWDFCMAVGQYTKKIGESSAFRATAQRWDGQKWTVLAVPTAAGMTNSSTSVLEDVSCTSSSACTAVGRNSTSKGAVPFVARWNGSEWSLQSTPVPAGLKGPYQLNGVACASASSCVAVGHYVSELESVYVKEEKTLIETWNGSEWQIQASPNAEGKKFNLLNAVSCSSASSCTAVGKAKTQRTSSDWVTLALRWNASAWSVQSSPNPAGASESALEDVSCASDVACVAVGNTDLANVPDGFTMQWNGSEWKVGLSQLPGPLYSVSCLVSGSCHAVGGGIGRAWSGSEWSVEDPFVATSMDQFQTRGVSCLPKMPCTAVGSYYGLRPSPTGYQPLAEHLPAPQGTPFFAAARLAAEGYPATITSTNPYGNHTWTFHTASQHCEAPQLQEATLEGQSAKQQAGAKDATCFDSFTGNKLKLNGCKLLYRFGAKTGATTFKGTVDVYCPTGQPITFTSGGADCQVAVPAQYGLPASYENVGAGKERAVKVTVSATGLKHAQFSGYNCGASIGNYADGTWSGSWKLQASSASGSLGTWVTPSETEGPELPPAGITISGTPPKLNAGTYPIEIAGDQKEGAQHVLATNAGTFKCTTAKLTANVSAATAQFSVTPEYAGCKNSGIPATIAMNGCAYTFNVLNQAPVGSTYAGHADIACPAGKAIEIVVQPVGYPVKCTITIAAQSTDAGGLSLTNEAATSTLGLALAIKGIDYHQQKGEGTGTCSTQDNTNGTYTGSSVLVGGY